MTVTHDTKKVMGVECVVVDDRAWEDGKLIERDLRLVRPEVKSG